MNRINRKASMLSYIDCKGPVPLTSFADDELQTVNELIATGGLTRVIIKREIVINGVVYPSEEEGVSCVYKLGYTYRTTCGRGRVTYQPDWDGTQPWLVYVDGTAMVNKKSLDDAKRTLEKYGCKVK